MSWEDADNAINKRFRQEVEDAFNVPVAYDNDGAFEEPANERWVRWTVIPGDSRQVSAGSPGADRFRHFGVAVAQIFIPVLDGNQPAVELADSIKLAFRNVTGCSICM